MKNQIKRKVVYAWKNGEPQGHNMSDYWGDLLGVDRRHISDYARRRKVYKEWFFSYDNEYNPKKKYDIF